MTGMPAPSMRLMRESERERRRLDLEERSLEGCGRPAGRALSKSELDTGPMPAELDESDGSAAN